MENRTIIWDRVALKEFVAAIEYIARDSIQNVEIVRSAIIKKIEATFLTPICLCLISINLITTAFTGLLNFTT